MALTTQGYRCKNTSRSLGTRKKILEHREIMEAYLGRKLRTDEHVHHINGVRTDNRIENLEVLSASDHARLTLTGQVRSPKRQEIVELSSKGFTQTQIAQIVGIDQGSVSRHLKRESRKAGI